MQHTTQVRLLSELIGLKDQQQAFLDDAPAQAPVSDYTDTGRFEQECNRIFRGVPRVVAHVSELAGDNAFLRRTINDWPLLIAKGDDGAVRIFLNVCRHRGTRLVDDHAGCRQRFSCPYHAWTWNNRGEFVNGPHFEAGFPGLDRAALGLKALRCEVRHGFVWLIPDDYDRTLETYLDGIDADLIWTGTANLTVHQSDVQIRHCNWKFIVEGGIEAYHFRVAHRNTIAKLFNDNLSSYECFGPHIRSVLPRSTLPQLQEQAESEWEIRAHANVLYSIFPSTSLLVQSDHVVWIRLEPEAVDRTRLTVTTLKPADTTAPDSYWDKHHGLSVTTLNEDFDLAESIHAGLASGANLALNFGRFEGALHRFNETVRARL